jgi:hypothetical protein
MHVVKKCERQLLVIAKVPSSQILFTQMMEVLSSSETLGFTKATRRNIIEGAILHSRHRENLKSNIYKTKISSTNIETNLISESVGMLMRETEP